MDHRYIEERNIPFLYTTGKLPQEERVRFEEHFMECADCQERLELLWSFRQGLANASGSPGSKPNRDAAIQGWSWRGWRPMLAAAGVAVLAAIPVWMWTSRMAVLRERDRAQLAASELANRLSREQEFSARLQQQSGQGGPGGVAIFRLTLSRGGDRPYRIEIAPTVSWIVFRVELVFDPSIRYLVSLDDAEARRVWETGGLAPESADSLTVLVPSKLLAAGNYTLTIEDRADRGRGGSTAIPLSVAFRAQ
jgi:hypothetical protein